MKPEPGGGDVKGSVEKDWSEISCKLREVGEQREEEVKSLICLHSFKHTTAPQPSVLYMSLFIPFCSPFELQDLHDDTFSSQLQGLIQMFMMQFILTPTVFIDVNT